MYRMLRNNVQEELSILIAKNEFFKVHAKIRFTFTYVSISLYVYWRPVVEQGHKQLQTWQVVGSILIKEN